MNLDATFEAQANLQRALKAHPEDIVDIEERIQYFLTMTYALEDELHEATQEMGWKPWASSRHINTDAVKSELVDAFQFFINLCSAMGMGAEELLFLHAEKLKKNYKRIEEGYDGVSTKCAWCGRALDDTSVSCERDQPTRSTGYCANKAQQTGDGFFTTTDLENRK